MTFSDSPVPSDSRREGMRATGPRIRLSAPGVLAVLYLAFFVVSTGGAGLLLDRPPYWFDWFDQGEYWRSALAFSHGDLAADQHWYPLLYSLLLAPLVWSGPYCAPLLVNLGLYLATFAGFERISRHFGLTRVHAAILFCITTLGLPQIGKLWIEPWTTTLSAALIWGALAFTAEAIVKPQARITGGKAALLGILLALIPCARPTDAVIPAILGTILAGHFLLARKDWRSLAILIGSGTAIVALYGCLYLAVWGPAPSAYTRLGAAFGFNFAWLGWKAYLLLIEPKPWFPHGTGILKAMPWLIFSAAGAGVMLMRRGDRVLTALLLLPAIVYSAIMLAFVDLLPSGLWRFNNIHYFKWLFPLAGLFAWSFVTRFRSAPMQGALALVVALAVSSIRIIPEPALPDSPARLLVYGGRQAPFTTVYMARNAIADRQGTMRNFFEYHQVPDENGLIHVDALRRDFQGNERLTRLGSPDAWPYAAPGFYKDAAAGEAAFGPLLGRFRPRVSIGVPCWLPGYTCPALTLQPLTESIRR